jgi:hypothetical protein
MPKELSKKHSSEKDDSVSLSHSEEEFKRSPSLERHESSRRRILDFIPDCIEAVSNKYSDNKIHLHIIDYDVRMVKLMLEWLYSGDINLPTVIKDVIRLSELSEVFMVDDLTNRCQEDIINHVNIDNVVSILCRHSILNKDNSNYLLSPNILKHCKTFFIKEFQEVLMHDKKVEAKI